MIVSSFGNKSAEYKHRLEEQKIIITNFSFVAAMFRTKINDTAIFTRLQTRQGRKEEFNRKHGVPRRPILTSKEHF